MRNGLRPAVRGSPVADPPWRDPAHSDGRKVSRIGEADGQSQGDGAMSAHGWSDANAASVAQPWVRVTHAATVPTGRP